MRHSGISDVLEGRSCAEPEHVFPLPSMVRRITRAVTRSQGVGEMSTQSGTRETPPADTPAQLHSLAREQHLQKIWGISRKSGIFTSVIFICTRVSAHSNEASQRLYNSCDPLELHAAVQHAQNKPTR